MRLHYYAPAVPESYCVGIHNGHGLGSVFARLFSKIAAKTAAKAAARVARTAGQKALKVAVTKGAQIGKQALKVAKDQGAKAIKEYGKEAITRAGEAAADFALEKINSTSEKAISKGLPPKAIHSLRDTFERGVRSAQTDATNAALKNANILVDKASRSAYKVGNRYIDKKVEQIAGRQPSPTPPPKTASRQFPSKIAASRKRRKAPKSSVSAKRKSTLNIQNLIEEA